MKDEEPPRIELFAQMRARYVQCCRFIYQGLLSVLVILALIRLAADVSVDALIKAGFLLSFLVVFFNLIGMASKKIRLECPLCQRTATFKPRPGWRVLRLQCTQCSTEYTSDCFIPFGGARPEKGSG
ncbi:hypothetical protein [Prosthecobacter sp.]|uniref:hypothetical protein n=1 Tax=Prosthecobacter sp. TaxID=1965333 RepID=UPI0037843A2D